MHILTINIKIPNLNCQNSFILVNKLLISDLTFIALVQSISKGEGVFISNVIREENWQCLGVALEPTR